MAIGAHSFSAENQVLSRAQALTQADQAYVQTQARYEANRTNAEAAWAFAGACYDRAEFAENNGQRSRLALEGIDAGRHAIQIDPKSAPAHYYLALNLGQKARTEKLAALKRLHEMESEFKVVITLDPAFDYAGGDRSLGLLYRDAPGWPTSLGSRPKAREHLGKAVQLAPDYPDNWLSLLESYLHWGDKAKVRDLLATAQDKIQAARGKLTGLKWQWQWQDWDQRWAKIKNSAAVQTIESPRTKGK